MPRMKGKAGNGLAEENMAEVVSIRGQHEPMGPDQACANAGPARNLSSEQYQTILSSINDLIYSTNAQGTITFITPNVLTFAGYRPEEVVGHNVLEFIHPDDAGRVIADMKLTMETGKEFPTLVRLMKKTGEAVWCEEIGRLLRNQDGAVTGLNGVIRDITERKRAEEALRESEERYATLFRSAAEGILIADMETKKFVYANPSICRMLGYSEEEMKRLGIQDIHPAESLEHVLGEFEAQVLGKRPLPVELPCRRKDGSIIYANIAASGMILNKRFCNVGFFSDVTERKRAEHEVRERMKELRAFYSLAEITSRKGITLDELYQELTNILPQSWQYPEIACARIVIGDSEFRTKNFTESAWKQSAPVKVNGSVAGRIDVGYLEKRPEEDEGPFQKEERLLIDAIAERTGHVTERKRAEEALRESEERYATLFRSAAEGILVADMETKKFVYANPSICRMLGYSEQEMKRLGVQDIHPAESLEHVRGEFEAQALGKRPLPVELPCRRKDGSVIYANIAGSGMILNKRHCNVGFFSDVTERRRMEEALRRSEEQYRLITENSFDPIWVMDLNLAMKFVSPAITRMLGYSVEEFMTLSLDRYMTPKSLEKTYETLKKALALEENKGRAEGWSLELEFIAKTGELVPVEIVANFLRDAEGKPVSIVGVARDIRERKLAEETRQKLLVSMGYAEKMASLGQFAAGVAHEVNNPLAYIKANLKVLDEYRRNIKDVFNAFERLSLSVAERAAFAALDQANNNVQALKQKLDVSEVLRDFKNLLEESREGVDRIRNTITSLGKFAEPPKAFPEPANIDSVLDNILNLIGGAIQKKADLQRVRGGLPLISCYPEELGQVFINLISNALNAIRGRGLIRIETENAAGSVRIKVSDNGVGISPEQINKIFDPFYSASGVGSAKGLGLSVSYGIIKKHKGEIRVISEPGKGSTFIVELPVEVKQFKEADFND